MCVLMYKWICVCRCFSLLTDTDFKLVYMIKEFSLVHGLH